MNAFLSRFFFVFMALFCTPALAGEPLAGETPDALFLPSGVTYTDGAAVGSKIITQETPRAVLLWNSFNIGKDASVTFNQLDGTHSIAVNRVVGSTDPTQILGKLSANGTVVILDPNGVIFGKDAVIDVGGIVASTGHLRNQSAFLNGAPMMLSHIDADTDKSIINKSTQFTIRDRGLAAFVAPSVQNNGIITARLGHVVLASGSAATLDFHGDRLITFEVTEGLAAALPDGTAQISNNGKIIAPGGTVQMTARAASAAIDTVINSDGLVVATHAQETRDGKIILNEGKMIVSDDKSEDRILPNSIRVGKNSSVQEAIDLAAEGTSVYLNEGTYKENLTISTPLSLKPFKTGTAVTLQGERARSGVTPENPIVLVNAPDVEISGFAFLFGLHGVQAKNADGLFIHDNFFINSFAHAIDLTNTKTRNDLLADFSNIFTPSQEKNIVFHTSAPAGGSPDNNRIFNTPSFDGFGSAPLVIEQAGIDVSALAALAPAAGGDHCTEGTDCGGN